MSTVIIIPGTKKQFDLAFNMLAEFGSERKPFPPDGKEEGSIDFAFLMKEIESAKEVIVNASEKK